jgi:hypothetical protein
MMDPDQANGLEQFQAVTNADDLTARYYLERAKQLGKSLETAIEYFFDVGGVPPPPGWPPATPPEAPPVESTGVHLVGEDGEHMDNFNPLMGVRDTPRVSFEEAMVATGLTGLEPYISGAKLFAQSKQDPLLDEDEIAGVHIFTMESPFFRNINSALASKDREKAKPYFRYLRLVLGGVFKCPLLKGNFTRGIKNPNLQNYQAGRAPFFWWAFSSTTKTVGTTQDFLGTGPRMLFMVEGAGVDIQKYSAIPSEAEVLMLPGTFLKFMDVLHQGDLAIVQLQQQPAAHMVDFEHSGLNQILGFSSDQAPAPAPTPSPAPITPAQQAIALHEKKKEAAVRFMESISGAHPELTYEVTSVEVPPPSPAIDALQQLFDAW